MLTNVTVVIVTYANRFNLVKQVIFAALEEGVSQIVLVDNASVEETRKELDKLIAVESRLTLIRHSENLGSAGGYHSGLSYVLESLYPDFVWMLDDDNVPQQGSLKALVDTWYMITNANNIDNLALYSYRGETREPDKRAVTYGDIKGYAKNNFMGFNFFKAVQKKINNKPCDSINYPVVRVELGPYGGAFFNFNVLKKIGLPRSEFFVYADDHEYTLRLNELCIQQYLVYGSRLKDIDISFDDDGLLSPKASNLKVYYTFRNHTYLSQSFIANKLIYIFNKYIFLLFLFKSLIFKSFKYKGFAKNRAKLIMKAINDGERSLLGKVDWLK